MRDPQTGDKTIRADVLRQLLGAAPAGALATPNAVGNLMLVAADGAYLGYIDLATEQIALDTTDKDDAR